MQSPVHSAAIATAIVSAGFGALGCREDGSPPELEAVADRRVAVGTELVVNLRASDPDGDRIRYGVSGPAPTLARNGDTTLRPDGSALFRWTPIAADLGRWAVDFVASDGHHEDVVTATIEVVAALEGTAPIFREPLGSGTTLDLARADCLDVSIVIDDPDDAAVTIAVEPPGVPGSALRLTTGLTATWHWCPSEDDRTRDRHPVVFSADDGENDKTLKDYLVVLRGTGGADCPGKAPIVLHEPHDVTAADALVIEATITDDVGLAGAPILYVTTIEPDDPIDFGAFDPIEMEPVSGGTRDGVWSARVASPVADASSDGEAPLWYVISARDDDDPEGDCDHVTDAPATGTFAITVRRASDACEDDALEDNDARVDAEDHPALTAGIHEGLVACPADEDWYRVETSETGRLGVLLEGEAGAELDLGLYDAAGVPVETSATAGASEVVEPCVPPGRYFVRVHGATARSSYTLLVDPVPDACPNACQDDAFEPNDVLADATLADLDLGPFSAGDLVICSGNDDLFEVGLYTGETLVVDLTFVHLLPNEDLDLHLLDANGVDLTPCTEQAPQTCTSAQGQSATSNEHYEHPLLTPGCVPCTFYVVVHGFAGSANDYAIAIDFE